MLLYGTYNRDIKLLKGTKRGEITLDWLKTKRNDKGLTQNQVAEKCAISRSYYTHIEKGAKTPTVPVAKLIGATLGFNWTVFFEDECSLGEHKQILKKHTS
jgi:transcriptional regulator with XRE-family HTH domain